MLAGARYRVDTSVGLTLYFLDTTGVYIRDFLFIFDMDRLRVFKDVFVFMYTVWVYVPYKHLHI